MNYDNDGISYTQSQRAFFKDRDDWTRNKLQAAILGNKSKKILDVGCGSGMDIAWCESQEIEAYGVDPSETMRKSAQEIVKNPDNILKGDYEHLPFDDASFDFVLGRFSLHYLKDFQKAYNEISRVLKTGGMLALTVSHPTFDAYLVSETPHAELISVKLFNGEVTVTYPPHSFSEYFSQTFLKLFDLSEMDESVSVDAENPRNLPETLFYTAIKR